MATKPYPCDAYKKDKNFNDSVCLEQKRIKLIMLKKIKEDPRLIRGFYR